MTKRDWQPIEGMDGFRVEMDISRPHGPVRHRRLPDGAWHDGYPTLDDVIGPSISIEGEDWTGAAHEFMEDLEAKVKAIAPFSDAPKDSEDR